ncbi:MAG: hydrogenase maturation nickel metallochaperone HypA [Elusimicrobiota bacterium]|nr:hydrogenase maturation nickel metallochaperone HypA [Elusimicrobiota bacterium]
MHELGIAKDLLDIVLIKAKENGLKKITKISVKIGEASGIEEDFLRHSLVDHLLPGTIASGCNVEISKEDVKAKCKKCSAEFLPKEMIFDCPSCQSKEIEILSGKDVYVASIEGE